MSILDEIILLPPSLAAINPLVFDANLNAAQRTAILNKNSDIATIRVPAWILVRTTPKQVGARWMDLCRQLQSLGSAIQCSSSDFEAIPIGGSPKRISQQAIERPFSAAEIQSADVVEITLHCAGRDQWGLPPEIGDSRNLIHLMESIRQAVGSSSAIAMGVPIGLGTEDIETILTAQPDILSLKSHTSTSDELTVATLTRIRSVLPNFSAQDLPILVETDHCQPEQLVKLIALGATGVSIDRVLEDLWEEKPEIPGGFLSTVQSGLSEKASCPIQARLSLLSRTLLRSLDWTSDRPLTMLRERLRATSDRAARLAKIPILES